MILAQTPSPPATGEYRVEWAWLETLRDDPTMLAVAAAAGIALLLVSTRLYWRERSAAPAPVVGLLVLLRLVAIAGVVVMLLGPQRRRAEQVVRPSRVVVLVDSSVSMAMPNTLGDGVHTPAPRHDAARRLLVEQQLIERLAETHQVSLAATSAVGKARLVDEASEAPPDAPDRAALVAELIKPIAAETRLGDALNQVLDEFAGEPLAGVVLLSDGRSNAGAPPEAAAAAVAAEGAKVVTVGFGPNRAGTNLVVRELVAPSKAYPADKIELTAVVEITGDPVGTPRLSLYRRPAGADEEADVLLSSRDVERDEGARSASVQFETKPEQAGAYIYTVRASPLPRETRRDDNQRDAEIEVVDRMTHVLLWAGGPNRDFRFLRNQLSRDDTFVVDILLQSASPGAQQDARAALRNFPETEDELNEYDVLAALDPDWSSLSDAQIGLLDGWVTKRGAGVYFAPGSVNTPRWVQRSPSPRIKSLLPVTFPEQFALLATTATPNTRPKRVALTRAGQDANFLWIAGGREASRDAWREFPGFYRVSQTASLRPGATVFAEVGDKATGGASVVFAEQFYGAGRVFFCGTTELWRLRAEEPEYFSAVTTQLLRRLAQGRLLADSPEGSLLFERDRYDLGTTMTVRAILPAAAETDTVRAQVVSPSGQAGGVDLQPSGSQRDAWVGRLPASEEGAYEAELSLVGGATLSARAEVVVPAVERDEATRNEPLLTSIAEAGGGWYYPTAEAALEGAGPAPALPAALPSREESRTLYGKPDRPFDQLISQSLLGVICGALCLEWLIRRMSRMA